MNPARRNEYLNAMGIEIWVPRLKTAAANNDLVAETTGQPGTTRPCGTVASLPAATDSLVIGPGVGNTILICGKSEDAATPLAADVARILDCEPVWAWPAVSDVDAGVPLKKAIEERLFTRVLVFGRDHKTSAGDSGVEVIGSAQLIRADSISTLLESAAARRALWVQLCAIGWCAVRAKNTCRPA